MQIDAQTKRRASIFVLLSVLITSMGFGIVMPVVPDLIRELAQVDLPQATRIGAWVGVAYAIASLLLGATMGNLSDRFGRRPIFLIAVFTFGADFLLTGFAPSIGWLFAARAIAGAFGAIFGPANSAMADMSSPEERAASFGKVGAAFGLGFILGPILGSVLSNFGTRLPFFAAGAMAVAVGIYGWFVFPETLTADKFRRFEWRRANPLGALASLGQIAGILPIATIYFLWGVAMNSYAACWSFFARAQYGWGGPMVGLSLTVVGVVMVLCQAVLIKRLVARFGERNTAYFGLVCGLLGFLFFAFVTNGLLALLVLFFSGAQGVTMPSLNAMMSKRAPASQQGELQGLNGTLAALGLLIAQLAFNNSLAYYTSKSTPFYFPGAPFIIAAAFTLAAIIGLMLLPKHSAA